jgi:hypothetical protein
MGENDETRVITDSKRAFGKANTLVYESHALKNAFGMN